MITAVTKLTSDSRSNFTKQNRVLNHLHCRERYFCPVFWIWKFLLKFLLTRRGSPRCRWAPVHSTYCTIHSCATACLPRAYEYIHWCGEQDYQVSMYLRQAWRDPRLAFSVLRDKLVQVRLGDKSWDTIWIPDTFLRNEKGANFHDVTVENRMLKLTASGDIWYVTKWVEHAVRAAWGSGTMTTKSCKTNSAPMVALRHRSTIGRGLGSRGC